MAKSPARGAAAELPARLADPADGAALLDLLVDFGLDQPVAAFVDADRLLAAIDRVLDERLVARTLAQHVKPGIERSRERLAARPEERVDDWLTEATREALRRLAARPIKVDEKVVRGFVEQDQVRAMIRSFVEDTLQRFIAAFKPGGSGGGVAGAVGRSAFGFASKVSGGLMGGLGEQIEAQLKKAAGGFVQTSLPAMIDRMIAQLTAPEAASRLVQTQGKLLEGALKTRVAKLAQQSAQVDLDPLLAAVPGLIAHNLARPEVRADLRAEIAAHLAVLGAEPVRALFVEPAHVEALKADVRHHGVPLLATLSTHAPLLAWLAGKPA